MSKDAKPKHSSSPPSLTSSDVLGSARKVFDAAVPYVNQGIFYGRELYHKYWQDSYGEIAYCLLLVFLGGNFALTILAMQAFEQAGGAKIRESFQDLKKTYDESMKKMQNDPNAKALFDKDGDGKVTIDEVAVVLVQAALNAKDPASLKTANVLMRCVNPQNLLDAVVGFWAGLVAVIAILKSNLAKAVSNGASIGQKVLVYAKVGATKPLYERFPEHKNWVDAGLQVICGLFGILLSLMIVRLESALNSALNGATRLSHIIMEQVKRRNMVEVQYYSTCSQAIIVALVFMGLNFQLSSGFSLPWYLKLLFLPLWIFENILIILANY
jgi:hypothetical protein